MSTFNLIIMLLFLSIFGVRLFWYCVDIELPKLSGILTLILIIMLISEVVLALFEFPAIVIDGIVLICMGNRAIAIGCGIVIFIMSVFIFIIVYPKINWKRVLSFSLIKYTVIGFLLIGLMIYTELFNGAYSFRNMDEYNEFRQSFAKYDNHFWPTKYIREVEDDGSDVIYKTSVYPWDVTIPDGKQFAYKVITYYSGTDAVDREVWYYYPFTYNLYAGIEPRPIEGPPSDSRQTVSDSDAE